ncbi:hypothetical protein SRB5_59910 [Streptomyces sp. RB5]|uniref:DUF5753 domain-containing protein n=2 Tax=Streptomyces smaragdinus TaxID=2585196 RepID=A0A7K0CQN9_9ACTN|nr:hypothetical protein [Streptomyces smaragdinus]
MEAAAERIDADRSKVSRMENGRQGVRRLELEAMLQLYGVEDQQTQTALLSLAREGRRKGWWHQHSSSLSPRLQEQLSIESDAARIAAYQPLLVPGLLQTESYARELIHQSGHAVPEDRMETYVSLRMARQEIFTREAAPQYLCIIDEAVLRRAVGGPEVMKPQLEKLLEINNPPELSVQVVPFSQGWHAGLDGPFSVYTYPDPLDLDVVGIDYLDGNLYVEDDAAVDKFRRAFEQLRTSALASKQSMHLISQAVRDID